jgi:hypothetical protein
MRIYLILLINLFCSGYAIAQSNNKVSGTVKDSLNRVLSGASVRVMYGSDTLNAVSDYRGKFSISGITASTVILNIRSMGYLPLEVTLQFHKG